MCCLLSIPFTFILASSTYQRYRPPFLALVVWFLRHRPQYFSLYYHGHNCLYDNRLAIDFRLSSSRGPCTIWPADYSSYSSKLLNPQVHGSPAPYCCILDSGCHLPGRAQLNETFRHFAFHKTPLRESPQAQTLRCLHDPTT